MTPPSSEKTTKKLNCSFKVQGVHRQKLLWNWKSWAPPNYVGRVRSNLNFEVILEVKRSKTQNHPKLLVFCTFWVGPLEVCQTLKSSVNPRRRSSNFVCSCLVIPAPPLPPAEQALRVCVRKRVFHSANDPYRQTNCSPGNSNKPIN